MTKKRFLVFFVAVIMALTVGCIAFTACGGDSDAKAIAVSKPTKTDYVVGEKLDLTGMVVTLTKSDNSKTELKAEEYTTEPAAGATLTENDKRVTVTYKSGEKTLTQSFNITVHNVVKNLTVKTEPANKTYWSGDAFDPEGLVLTATYENGNVEDVTVKDNAAVSYDKSALISTTATDDEDEIQAIEFTYKGAKVSQNVTVKYNPVTELVVKTQPKTTTYMKNQPFDATGLVLTATFKSGKSVDVNAATDKNVTYKTGGLTADDSDFEVNYGGKTVTISITMLKGIFVEAESGDIVSTSVNINSNSVRKANTEEGELANESGIWVDENGNQINTASGGKYIGNLKSGDTVTFMFDSEQAGTITILLRMASQYLKEDKSWAPIWMGDCQVNKIMDVTVNNAPFTITDDVILPGGGKQGGETDATLWYNWQDVPVQNVTVQKGRNTITLKFKEHDYTDCSQDSFKGKFTANIDSLILDSGDDDIDFTAYGIDIEMPLDNSGNVADIDKSVVEMREIGGKPYYVLGKGAYSYSVAGNYTEEEIAERLQARMNDRVKEAFNFDLQANPNADGVTNNWTTVCKNTHEAIILSDTEYALAVDLSDIGVRAYTTHCAQAYKGTGSGKDDFKAGVAMDKTYAIGNRMYEIISIPGSGNSSEFWGNVGIRVSELSITKYPADIDDETFEGLEVSLTKTGTSITTTKLEAAQYTAEKKDNEVTVTATITEGEGDDAQTYTLTASYSTAALGIEITNLPADLAEGSYDGLTVAATYVNGQKKDVASEDLTFEVADGILTVSYGTFTASCVIDKAPSNVNYVDDNFFAASSWGTNAGYVNADTDPEKKTVTVAAGTAVRNENFFNVPTLDAEGNPTDTKVNIGHNTGCTEASNLFGVEQIWTMDVKANGAFGFMLFATNGVGTTPSNAYSAYYVDYANGKFSLRGSGVSDGRILATSYITSFSETEVNQVTLSITRESAQKILFKLYVNGKQVYFVEANNNDNNGGKVIDGAWQFNSRGHGPRLNVVAGAETTVVISAPVEDPETPEVPGGETEEPGGNEGNETEGTEVTE